MYQSSALFTCIYFQKSPTYTSYTQFKLQRKLENDKKKKDAADDVGSTGDDDV